MLVLSNNAVYAEGIFQKCNRFKVELNSSKLLLQRSNARFPAPASSPGLLLGAGLQPF